MTLPLPIAKGPVTITHYTKLAGSQKSEWRSVTTKGITDQSNRSRNFRKIKKIYITQFVDITRGKKTYESGVLRSGISSR